jgi:hypothetical protein
MMVIITQYFHSHQIPHYGFLEISSLTFNAKSHYSKNRKNQLTTVLKKINITEAKLPVNS